MIFISSEETNNILTRGLRGGSGGGGGGGGGIVYGGGGSNGSGGGGLTTAGIIALVLIPIIGLVIAFWYVCTKSCPSKGEFDKYDENSKEEVITHVNEKSRSVIVGMHTPTDGVYEIKYEEESETYDASATLIFTDNGKGYDLSGTIEDKDGKSKIEDSIIAYNGKAYWKDVIFSGDLDRTVVSKGDFDFENNTFSGRWDTWNKGGPYTHFKLLYSINSSAQPCNDKQVVAEAEEFVVVPAVVVPDVVKPSAPPAPDQANSNATGGGGASLFDQINSAMKK